MSLTSRLPRDVLFTSSKSCDKLTVWSNTEIAAKAMCEKKQADCCYTMEFPSVSIVCTPSILEYPFLNYSGARNNFSRYRPTLLQFERGMRSSPCYSTFFRFSRLPPLSHKPLLKPGGSNRILKSGFWDRQIFSSPVFSIHPFLSSSYSISLMFTFSKVLSWQINSVARERWLAVVWKNFSKILIYNFSIFQGFQLTGNGTKPVSS